MTQRIEIPSTGDRLKAAWGAAVANRLNDSQPFAPSDMLTSEGPAGNGFTPLPANRRNRRFFAADRSCWRIEGAPVSATDGDGTRPLRRFADCHHMVGGKLLLYTPLEASSTISTADLPNYEYVESFVCQGELSEGQEYTAADKPFIAFVRAATSDGLVPEPSGTAPYRVGKIVGYKTLIELQAAQNDLAHYVHPLYILTHDGAVKTDLRTAQHLQMWEAAT